MSQVLYFVATHPNVTIRYCASNMILNVHSDALYLSKPCAQSRVAGHYFLGMQPQPHQTIRMNGSIFTFCGILKCVVASTAKAKLTALLLNCKEAKIIRLILTELGHRQPSTPIHCDNKTATGLANNRVKKQRSRSMEMRFFWVADQVKCGAFFLQLHPGQENLADFSPSISMLCTTSWYTLGTYIK